MLLSDEVGEANCFLSTVDCNMFYNIDFKESWLYGKRCHGNYLTSNIHCDTIFVTIAPCLQIYDHIKAKI